MTVAKNKEVVYKSRVRWLERTYQFYVAWFQLMTGQILGLGTVFSQNLIRAKTKRAPKLWRIDGCNTQRCRNWSSHNSSSTRSETDPDA